LDEFAHDHGAGGVDEAFEFAEVLVDEVTGIAALQRRADQDGALDRGGEGDDFF
jgi:hypothetical protein